MLRHDPHVVVMTMVGCLLRDARSAVQLTLSLSGSYMVRSVNPASTSILAEEGYGGCRCRLGWEDMIVSIVGGWVFPDIELVVAVTHHV